MSILVKCEVCHASKTKSPSQIKEHNFCSNNCRLKWFAGLNKLRKNKITCLCEWCNHPFETYPCWLRRNEGRFCNRLCQGKWHSYQMRRDNKTFASTWQKMAEEEKQQFRERISRRQKGKKYPPEVNKKKGRSGKLASFYGRHHTPQNKELLSKLAKKRMQDPKYRQRVIQAALKANRRKPNKAELKLQVILNEYFPSEWQYTGDGYHIIGGFAPDFSNCNGAKAVIELFGKYWHEEVPHKWSYTELGRIMAYNSLGYPCLVIWQHELKDEKAVVAKIKQFMKHK